MAGNNDSKMPVTAKWFERVLAKVGLPFYFVIFVLIISLVKLLLEASARGLLVLSPQGFTTILPPSCPSCI
jgi:hypothetical protein